MRYSSLLETRITKRKNIKTRYAIAMRVYDRLKRMITAKEITSDLKVIKIVRRTVQADQLVRGQERLALSQRNGEKEDNVK